MKQTSETICWLDAPAKHLDSLGHRAKMLHKASGVAQKYCALPKSFVIPAHVYWSFLRENELYETIRQTMKTIDAVSADQRRVLAKQIRQDILAGSFLIEDEKQIIAAVRKVAKHTGAVSIVSDADTKGYDGSYLQSQDAEFHFLSRPADILHAIKKTFATVFSLAAIEERRRQAVDQFSVAPTVHVRETIDVRASGHTASIDSQYGFDGVCDSRAQYGLFQGHESADEYVVLKSSAALIDKRISNQQTVTLLGKTRGTREAAIQKRMHKQFVLSEKEASKVASAAIAIEASFGRPVVLSWIQDKKRHMYLWDIQYIDVPPQDYTHRSTYILKEQGEIIVHGTAIGRRIGAGKVQVLNKPLPEDMKARRVVVTKDADGPAWNKIMKRAAAMILEIDDPNCYAARFCREHGIPCLINVPRARRLFKQNQPVTVSCSLGDRAVYAGLLPFEVIEQDFHALPKTQTSVSSITHDASFAFMQAAHWQRVGNVNIEQLMYTAVTIDPVLLLHTTDIEDEQVKAEVDEIVRGYKKPSAYLTSQVAAGVARIAASHEKKQVTIFLPLHREYGDAFFDVYMDALALVREWGLKNIAIRFPYLPSVEEVGALKAMLIDAGAIGKKQHVFATIHLPTDQNILDELDKVVDGVVVEGIGGGYQAYGFSADKKQIEKHVDSLLLDSLKKVIRTTKQKGNACQVIVRDHEQDVVVAPLLRIGVQHVIVDKDAYAETVEQIAFTEQTVGRTGKKNNIPVLSAVALWGVLAIGLVALGAGCSGSEQERLANENALGISPAEIRQRVEERVNEQKEEEFDKRLTPLRVDTFAQFEIKYPSSWSVDYWNGGVSFTNEETGEFVSLFKQLIGHPVPRKSQTKVAGYDALTFEDQLPENGDPFTVYEISFEDTVLEINGNSERLQDMLATLQFTSSTPTSKRPATHWDVREKRFCVQMITYARKRGGQCQAFSTPCDVPDSWTVCDEDDS